MVQGLASDGVDSAAGGKQILIVEDDESVAELVAYRFEAAGYETVIHGDGIDALEALEKTDELPAVILLDLVMPGLSGLDVLARLKEDTRLAAVPVVVLTAREADAVVEEAFSKGARDYVTKPFSPTALVARVERLLA